MDVSNLRSNYPKLLAYLAENHYGKAHTNWIKRCINLVLTDGASSEIESYEQLYWFEVEKCGYVNKCTRKTFRCVLGTVWQFDKTGKCPVWYEPTGFMAPPKDTDLLSKQFKCILEQFQIDAKVGGKRDYTVKVESRAAVCFLFHLQARGKSRIEDVCEPDVQSFFYDGEKTIRSRAYVDKVLPALKTAVNMIGEPAADVISMLPKMPKARRNYQYLRNDESAKLRAVIHDENASCNLLDKAIVAIAYYTGMRGTDIRALTLDNIDWDNDSIHIIQSKTGEELRIPLTTSVGNALWDYITSQRPRSVKEEILVSDRRPFIQLPHLWHHIKKVFNEADVRREGGRTGVRIFRHHLATSLLANETEAPVISSILGHRDPDSLNPYLDADIEHLRECALSIEKYPVAEEALML
jgi:integrase